MYKIFDSDPTYGIKNPEHFFSLEGPEFLNLWFIIQSSAQKEDKIFFLDEIIHKDNKEILNGWLIPYENRRDFYSSWISEDSETVKEAWKDSYVDVTIVDNNEGQEAVFNQLDKTDPFTYEGSDYEVIDLSTWERAEHYNKYNNYLVSEYTLALEADITNFLAYLKKKGLSFTLGMSYAVAQALNEVEEFKYRRKGKDIIKFKNIDPIVRYLNKETQLYKDIRMPLTNSLEGFISLAKKKADSQQNYFVNENDLDVVQLSSTPWFSFTSISPLVAEKNEPGIPMIVWGKYTNKDGRIILPISIQIDHVFVDGVHIGQFLENLQNYLDSF